MKSRINRGTDKGINTGVNTGPEIIDNREPRKQTAATNTYKRASVYLKRAALAGLLGVVGVGLAACGGEAASAVPITTPQAQVAGQITDTPSPGTSAPAGETPTSGTTDTAPGAGDIAQATATTEPQSNSTGGASTSQPAAASRLNLNTATEEQLTAAIPNFPARMVREFMEYRPYSSIQQFRKEIGKYVDQSQIAEWEKYVYVPVDPNSADAETLKQLPGVDDAAAQALIGARPYASNDAFLQALGKDAAPEQVAQAQTYLTAK